MKIIRYDKHYVKCEDGESRSYNEVIWNYRSSCCGAALKRDGNNIVCKFCDEKAAVESKNIVRQRMADMKDGIDALPEGVREKAIAGFLTSIEKGLEDLEMRDRILDARITHIWDGVVVDNSDVLGGLNAD